MNSKPGYPLREVSQTGYKVTGYTLGKRSRIVNTEVEQRPDRKSEAGDVVRNGINMICVMNDDYCLDRVEISPQRSTSVPRTKLVRVSQPPRSPFHAATFIPPVVLQITILPILLSNESLSHQAFLFTQQYLHHRSFSKSPSCQSSSTTC